MAAEVSCRGVFRLRCLRIRYLRRVYGRWASPPHACRPPGGGGVLEEIYPTSGGGQRPGSSTPPLTTEVGSTQWGRGGVLARGKRPHSWGGTPDTPPPASPASTSQDSVINTHPIGLIKNKSPSFLPFSFSGVFLFKGLPITMVGGNPGPP